MAASGNKTVETKASVDAYLKKIKDVQRKSDMEALVELFSEVLKIEPRMWGTAIIGFGSYHYKYESGREGDAPLAGLSSRANAIVLYLSSTFPGREEMLEKLGKHTSAKACVYVKRLADVDVKVLGKMVKASVAHMKKKHP